MEKDWPSCWMELNKGMKKRYEEKFEEGILRESYAEPSVCRERRGTLLKYLVVLALEH